MGLLLAMTACCCAVLIGIAAALWVSLRREHAPGGSQALIPFADALLRAAKVEMLGQTREQVQRQRLRQPHPRMDLAAGMAAGSLCAVQKVSTGIRMEAAVPQVAPAIEVVKP